MKTSRSASKKRPAKKTPAKARSAAAKRKSPTKKKAVTSRSAAAKRRAGAKTTARAGAKKTRARQATKQTTRKKPARPTARTRKTAAAKKPSVRAAAPRTPNTLKPIVPTAPVVPANELKAGVVTHYYSHLSVAVIAVTDRGLRLGDRIHIKGHTSDFYQAVGSMQVEHDTISAAVAGQTVGLKVTEHAREHDTVYLVT